MLRLAQLRRFNKTGLTGAGGYGGSHMRPGVFSPALYLKEMPLRIRSLRQFLLGPVIALTSIVGAASLACAMTVSPTHIEMQSAGARNTARVTVFNSSSAPLPIEAVVHFMQLDENGKSRTTPAGEDFLVMPPQALIPPGSTQVFRVRWLGEPALDASRSYFLYMNQIPVKLTARKSVVQVVMSMAVMINVAPPRGAPALQLIDTGVTRTPKGQLFPTITVANRSNVHGLLPQGTVQLMAAGWNKTLSPAFLNEKVGIGLVQPGKQRKFILPVELPSNVSGLKARIAPATP